MRKILLVVFLLINLCLLIKGESFRLSPFLAGGIVSWNEENCAATIEYQLGLELKWKRFVAQVGFWNNRNQTWFNWNEYLISKTHCEGGEFIFGFNFLNNQERKVRIYLGAGAGVLRSLQWLLPNDGQTGIAPVLIHKGICGYIPLKFWIEKELFSRLALLLGIEKKLDEDMDYTLFFVGLSF